MRTVIIVSSLVDITIKERQHDTKFYIFKTLEELDKYTFTTPIRADILYFTRDVIPLVNSSLNYMVTLLNRVFLKVDEVTYITEENSEELKSIKFLIDVNGYTNWNVVQGVLTREFVSNVITGEGRSDNTEVRRKAVYRVSREEYVSHKSKHTDLLSTERYKDDDERIAEMPDEVIPVYVPPERVCTCECYDIIGESNMERTVFAFIVAQYLAHTGKTLILERDVEYHRLGDIVTKSGVECDIFYVDDILAEPFKVINRIRESSSKMICCICKSRVEYSYSFIFNLLFNNLSDCLTNIIREGDFGEEPTETFYWIIFNNTMPSLLKMCELVDNSTLSYAKFVAIHTPYISEVRLPNAEIVEKILTDVLNDSVGDVNVVGITSLKLNNGDSMYDIRKILQRR